MSTLLKLLFAITELLLQLTYYKFFENRTYFLLLNRLEFSANQTSP
jgi:hypothetical protein